MKAENAMLTSEMMARFLDRTPGVLLMARLDPKTGKSEWIYISPKAAGLYGLEPAVLMADPFSMMTHMFPEDRALIEKQIQASMETLAPLLMTTRIRHPDGKVRWIESQSTFERDTDGTILSFGQMLDVTERKELELMHRAVIEALPVGIMVMDAAGKFLVYNPAAGKYAGGAPDGHEGDLTRAFGVFETDGTTPFANDRLPLLRALAGEESPEEEMIVRNAYNPEGYWGHVTGTPIRDAAGKIIAGMVSFYDVSTQRKLERDLVKRNEELSASEEAKSGLIERLRHAVDELSNPILEVWDDVLAMPIIGIVDSRRTSDMVQRLLAEVARTQASFVIVDLTGVEIVDTKTADHLMKLIRKVELVGARCVLTGIRPAVSETLVDIGVDFGSMTTLRNLKHGLREALRSARRERNWARELELDDAEVEEPKPRRRTNA